MPILMAVPVAARIVQVLIDNLFTRTTALDAALADGITTPEIVADHYYDYDANPIDKYPSVSIQTLDSEPIAVQQASSGQRIDAAHHLRVKFHARMVEAQAEARRLEKIMMRYVCAAADILAVMKDGLETVADPTRWGSPNAKTSTFWAERASYGPEEGQGTGFIVRTAVLPIDVRRTEPH